MSSATAEDTAPRSGARVLFAVPFRSAMSDADVERLNRGLDMATHLRPKLAGSPVRPALARLDSASGLFLVHGDAADRWRLEARTWGSPPPAAVRRWNVLAADAARALDPTVPPPRSPAPAAAASAPGPRAGRWARLRGGGWQA